MKRLIQQLKRFGDDERGVSPVVGFVLIFALIMIVFTIYQADVVPSQNEQVEYEHSQTVEGQMEQLSAAIVNTAGSGANTSVSQRTSIQTGVQYPSRAFAIGPRKVVSSDVYLSQWPMSDRVEVHGIANSYDEADIVVYFILEDGSRRPVYIDATVPGSTTTANGTADTNTTTTETATTTP